MSDLVIPAHLRDLLEANLLEARDLVEAIALAEIEERPGEPGSWTCRCIVPVRRAFDPETAELRRLELELRRHESGGWEVESIGGLSRPAEL